MSGRTAVPAQDYDSVGEGMQYLVGMLRFLFFGLRILIAVVFVALVFGGVFSVEEHEEAMLFHFGKLTPKDGERVITSGDWYWAWPYPIDEVRKIPAQRSVTVTSRQFWLKEKETGIDSDEGEPDAPDKLTPGEHGYLVTGDANIVHMIWTVTYRVSDAEQYYLTLFDDSEAAPGHRHSNDETKRGAEAIIRSVLDSAVLSEVGAWSIEDILVLSRTLQDGVRQSLSEAVQARFEAKADKLMLGIAVQQVSLEAVAPPGVTAEAFREVIAAAHDHRTEIDRARAYSDRARADAEAKASKILADARAYRTRVEGSIKADSAYFAKVLDEYNKNPDTMLVALHTNAIEDLLNKVKTKYVVHAKDGGRQEIRLKLGPPVKVPGRTDEADDEDSADDGPEDDGEDAEGGDI